MVELELCSCDFQEKIAQRLSVESKVGWLLERARVGRGGEAVLWLLHEADNHSLDA